MSNPYGARLRALRKHQGLTLLALAQRSGVDKSTISYLERGLRSGTVDLLSKLCRALGITLADFYTGLEHWQGPEEVQRSQARIASYVVPERGLTIQHLTANLLGKPFGPALLHLIPGGATVQEELRPGAVKFCYVLEGELEVNLKSARHTLGCGDSVFFDAAQPHAIKNIGSVPAKAFLVASPPTV